MAVQRDGFAALLQSGAGICSLTHRRRSAPRLSLQAARAFWRASQRSGLRDLAQSVMDASGGVCAKALVARNAAAKRPMIVVAKIFMLGSVWRVR